MASDQELRGGPGIYSPRRALGCFCAVFALVVAGAGLSLAFTVRDELAEATHRKLIGDLAMVQALLEQKCPGDWSLHEGQLFKGATRINGNGPIVDRLGTLSGDVVAIFQGELRVSTNQRKPSGERAVGTRAAEPPLQSTLRGGQLYIGQTGAAEGAGETAYVPVKNAAGEILGMLAVGVPRSCTQAVTKVAARMAACGLAGFLVLLLFRTPLTGSLAPWSKRSYSTGRAGGTVGAIHELPLRNAAKTGERDKAPAREAQ